MPTSFADGVEATGTVVRKRAPGCVLSYPGGVTEGRTHREPGNVVPAQITPLRLESFEQLPKHARCCVFWELDPSTLAGDDHLADPEFEKEAWLSMVMLEWGSCGQLAVQCGDDEAASADGHCLGYAF